MYLRNGKVLTGKAIDFDDELDNATGYDSIYLKIVRGTFDINEYEIKSIKEIEWFSPISIISGGFCIFNIKNNKKVSF